MPSTEEPRTRNASEPTRPSPPSAPAPWPPDLGTDVSMELRDGETSSFLALPASATGAGMTLALRGRTGDRAGLEPAFFVHGLGGSSRNWSALMARVDRDVDCLAVDLPGHGASPPPADRDYSLYTHTRAVIRAVAARGRGPVHLIGQSLGGAVATRVAALRPDLVRTLTLVSPALPEVRVPRTALPTALLAAPGVARLLRRLARDLPPASRARDVLALTYGDPDRIAPEELAAAVAEFERRQALPYFWESLGRSARGLVNAYTLGGQQSLWKQAERVLAPTLLVYGGRDKLVSARSARRAEQTFPDARFVLLPDAGHVAMMEYPGVVADVFRELLAETAAGPDEDGHH
ncbi:alpha/beta fold hydrolase [Streptomyces sp. NPDC059853]|uniref:alpha/beta fold hydrolase n=1 Tax=Streptomyces sp. NPDC059853 TaxID=3346973 RepID=UPI003661CE9F